MKRGRRAAPGIWEAGPGRWMVEVSRLDPAHGKQVRRRRYVEGRSLIEARRGLGLLTRELEDEISASSPPATTPGLSVTDYGARWLEAKAATVRPTTLEEYARAVEWLCRYMGLTPAMDVRRWHVQQFSTWLEGERQANGRVYAQSTIQTIFRASRTMLRDLAADLAIEDPTRRVTPPHSAVRAVRELETLSPQQLADLLVAVDAAYPQWSCAVHVLALTGMRLGELRALRWQDVDTARRIIRIERSASRGRIQATKTGDPRDTGIGDDLAARIEAHRVALAGEDAPVFGPALVFPSWATHGVVAVNTIHDVLKVAAREAGIEQGVGPQVLRRTFVTLMSRHVDRLVLRDVVGHVEEAMTARYSRSAPGERRDAAATAERIVAGRKVLAPAPAAAGGRSHAHAPESDTANDTSAWNDTRGETR